MRRLGNAKLGSWNPAISQLFEKIAVKALCQKDNLVCFWSERIQICKSASKEALNIIARVNMGMRVASKHRPRVQHMDGFKKGVLPLEKLLPWVFTSLLRTGQFLVMLFLLSYL